MTEKEKIKEGIKDILTEDLINYRNTHESPPPRHDCEEECGVSLEDRIAASNPILKPMRSAGKKHKKCMGCWEEYIENLTTRILEKEHSQGVAIKGKSLKGIHPHMEKYHLVEPLIEEL